MAEQDEQVQSEQVQDQAGALPAQLRGHNYYSELIRIVTAMFVGVLALMTFLLTVGVQRPHEMFTWALYSSLVILPLNLLAYVFGHLLAVQTKMSQGAAADDKKRQQAAKRLGMMRLVQQILFMLAVLAVAWFAFEAARFFATLPSANPAGGATPQ